MVSLVVSLHKLCWRKEASFVDFVMVEKQSLSEEQPVPARRTKKEEGNPSDGGASVKTA
jgi:hypothetical protein